MATLLFKRTDDAVSPLANGNSLLTERLLHQDIGSSHPVLPSVVTEHWACDTGINQIQPHSRGSHPRQGRKDDRTND